MNDLVKNLMLWVVVAVVLMVVFQSFSAKTAGGSAEIIYSQFITDVRGDRTKEVDIASDERSIKFTRTAGSTGITTARRNADHLLDELLKHTVANKHEPTESASTIWATPTTLLTRP